MTRAIRSQLRTTVGALASTGLVVATLGVGAASGAERAPLALQAHVVPACSHLSITVHSTTTTSLLVVYRLAVTNPSAHACRVSGSPAAQSVAGSNHHPIGMSAQAKKIGGAGNTPGNLTLTLPARGTVAHYYATYETTPARVLYALQAQCTEVSSDGVRITFASAAPVIVPLKKYFVCSAAKVTYVGSMAKY